MKHVGVREFKDHANALINAAEPLVIERHGQPVGFYLPLPRSDRAAALAAAERLAETTDAIRTQMGWSEDELVAAFLEAE
jgi:antitoxin (DNA-binding transcriptional repressor) of toxin-antitoxin stability system